MVRQKLTDLIPIWELYNVYRRKDNDLNFYEREALRENDRAQRMVNQREISSTEQKQRCDASLKESNRKCRNMVVYSAGVVVYNLAAAYTFYRLMESFAR